MLKALNLNNINKSYGLIKALDNIDFIVNDGEFFSLLGPSGSGKTTCLKVIAGFEAPDNGNVSILKRMLQTSLHSKDMLILYFKIMHFFLT